MVTREVQVPAAWLKQLLWTEGKVTSTDKIVGASFQANQQSGFVVFLVEEKVGKEKTPYG